MTKIGQKSSLGITTEVYRDGAGIVAFVDVEDDEMLSALRPLADEEFQAPGERIGLRINRVFGPEALADHLRSRATFASTYRTAQPDVNNVRDEISPVTSLRWDRSSGMPSTEIVRAAMREEKN